MHLTAAQLHFKCSICVRCLCCSTPPAGWMEGGVRCVGSRHAPCQRAADAHASRSGLCLLHPPPAQALRQQPPPSTHLHRRPQDTGVHQRGGRAGGCAGDGGARGRAAAGAREVGAAAEWAGQDVGQGEGGAAPQPDDDGVERQCVRPARGECWLEEKVHLSCSARSSTESGRSWELETSSAKAAPKCIPVLDSSFAIILGALGGDCTLAPSGQRLTSTHLEAPGPSTRPPPVCSCPPCAPLTWSLRCSCCPSRMRCACWATCHSGWSR